MVGELKLRLTMNTQTTNKKEVLVVPNDATAAAITSLYVLLMLFFNIALYYAITVFQGWAIITTLNYLLNLSMPTTTTAFLLTGSLLNLVKGYNSFVEFGTYEFKKA